MYRIVALDTYNLLKIQESQNSAWM